MKAQQDKGLDDGIFASLSDLIHMRAIAAQVGFSGAVKSQSMMDGAYASNKRGRGMEFAEVRPYQAGDDIRTIDWRVTARTQETYTKLFQEEKERPVYLVVDQRESMFFGSRCQFKSFLAAKLAAFIAWGTLKNNDSLGSIVFDDKSQSDLRPKRGKRSTLRFLSTLSEFNLRLGGNTSSAQHSDVADPSQSLASILKELRRIARPGSSIFVISDFHDLDSNCERNLSILSRHNDVQLIQIYDPLEKTLPQKARLSITDGENRYTMNTFNRQFMDDYENKWQRFHEELVGTAMRSRIQLRSISTELPANEHINTLFHTGLKSGHQR